ncbi:MAG: tetratricopeptide repeat protein, partial [Bacteroidota bacterium]
LRNKGIYDLVVYYLPILEFFITYYKDSKSLSSHRIFVNLSVLYRFNGQFKEAIEISKKERKVLEEYKYEYPTWYSTLLRNIGFSNQLRGNYSEAEESYASAEKFLLSLDSSENKGNKKLKIDSELILLYTHLGQIQLLPGKYDLGKAIIYFERGIELAENEHLEASGALATLKEGIAVAHLELGNHREAVDELREVQNIYTEKLGIHEDSLIIGQLNSLLAIAYSGNGNHVLSLNLAKNSKDILKKNFGDDSIEMVRAYSGEAITIINKLVDLKELDDYNVEDYKELIADAKQSLSKATNITKKIKGDSHPDLAIMYSNYSLILSLSKEFDEGYDYAVKALELMKNVGIENPVLMGLYMRLYVFFEEQTTYDLVEEGMNVALRIIPNEHDHLLNRGFVHYSLGIIMHEYGEKSRKGIIEIDKALKCIRDYFNGEYDDRISSDEKSPLEVTCLEQKAYIYFDLDETSNALEIQKEVIEICRANMDPKDEEFAERYLIMCRIHLKAAKQYAQLSYYAKALEYRELMRLTNPDLLKQQDDLEDFASVYLVPAPSNRRVCVVVPEDNRIEFSKKIKNKEDIILSEYGHILKQLQNEKTDKMIERYSEKYGAIEMELVK